MGSREHYKALFEAPQPEIHKKLILECVTIGVNMHIFSPSGCLHEILIESGIVWSLCVSQWSVKPKWVPVKMF